MAYPVSGMTALLHGLGFATKKPKLVPGKADREAQEAFLAQYEELKKNKGENDVVLFMDAVHLQHESGPPVTAGSRAWGGAPSAIPTPVGGASTSTAPST